MKRLALILAILVSLLCASVPRGALAAEPSDGWGELDRQLAEDVRNYHIPAMAVAVVDRGGVLFEGTYGNCDSADRPFIIGSLSKSFTALAVMQLAEQGEIDIDRPIDDYIDASRWFSDGADNSRITVRDLLDQTSGVTTYQTFGSLESTDAYGTHVYANANYGLLGLITEAVSGQSYEQYITRNIFEPLGMTHSAASLEKSRENGLIEGYRNFFGVPVAGEPDYPGKIGGGSWTNVPAGYISSSLSDMEKYLQMYLRGGDGIISPESIDRMFYENVPDGEGFYGMGWRYSPDVFGQPVLDHDGLAENYASYMFILPEKGIAAVFLVNTNDYLVGNGLLAFMTASLLGGERASHPYAYVLAHTAIDAAYLLLFFLSFYSLFTLKRWRTRVAEKRVFVSDILRHAVLPAVLLLLPAVIGVPYWVVWLFVKDLSVVLFANAFILICVGVYKLIHLINKKAS